MRLQFSKLAFTSIAAAAMLTMGAAQADTGKLSLTGGITSIDGAAGGGITPWATIGTMGNEIGVSAAYSTMTTQDYGLKSYGVSLGINDRAEVSFGRQELDIGKLTFLGGNSLAMNVMGAKIRVAGEAILDSDNLMPQISVGILVKQALPTNGPTQTVAGVPLNADSVITTLGAKTQGTEYYVSASKLLLNKGLLLNGTLRYTNANQNGLLGFGSGAGGNNESRIYPEFSAAYLLSPKLAIGAEYRFKPNNLEGRGNALKAALSGGSAEPVGNALGGTSLAEDDWKDVFIAYTPTKNLTLTLAYVDMGRVVSGFTSSKTQQGTFLSAQVAF
jgi:hypothetical protein